MRSAGSPLRGCPSHVGLEAGRSGAGEPFAAQGHGHCHIPQCKYANQQQGNHAALYMGQTLDGILVMDQWRGKRLGIVTSRTLRSKGQYKNGLHIDPSNNADAFFVIE
jgi:hypothetical protein